MTETKKIEAVTGTELTRFNALSHGILSRFTVLPWENREEYESTLAALVAEHAPQGPTEEHLVEELAHIMWRKRRLRLAESAAHRRALATVLSPLSHLSPEKAVLTIPPASGGEWIERAISATDQQSAEELVDLKQERDKAKMALEVLRAGTADAYDESVEALGPQTLEHWQERLKYDFGDGEAFQANASDLLRFLTKLVLPEHDKREIHIKSRPVVQAQAFGESFDPNRLEVLARYEVHLDRKLERILTMLLGLKDLRRPVNRG
jgi:hypothetical protein